MMTIGKTYLNMYVPHYHLAQRNGAIHLRYPEELSGDVHMVTGGAGSRYVP